MNIKRHSFSVYNHGSRKNGRYLKGNYYYNYYWREPFLTSTIMGGMGAWKPPPKWDMYQLPMKNTRFLNLQAVPRMLSPKVFLRMSTYTLENQHTVDGRNPAPVGMVNIPLFTGFYTSRWLFGISSINSITWKLMVGRWHLLSNGPFSGGVSFCMSFSISPIAGFNSNMIGWFPKPLCTEKLHPINIL